MITRVALRVAAFALGLGIALPASAADTVIQRMAPGNSTTLSGTTFDVYGGIYAPPVGNYSVLYSGSANPHNGTDASSTLDCGKNNTTAVTYTLPQISTSVFPVGQGVGFINTSQTFPCTITATGTISGAPGVTSGIPIAAGGPITLLPDGQVWLQSDGTNWRARDFNPGIWVQNLAGKSAVQWLGLSGYTSYHIHCFGVLPTTAGDFLLLQIAYNGTFQTVGYSWTASYTVIGATAVSVFDSAGSGPTTAFAINGAMASPADFGGGAGATFDVDLDFADGTGTGYRRSLMSRASYPETAGPEVFLQSSGPAPINGTAESITGIQIFDGGSGSPLRTGKCSAKPSL